MDLEIKMWIFPSTGALLEPSKKLMSDQGDDRIQHGSPRAKKIFQEVVINCVRDHR
jgi:hypothetical protein